MSDKSHSNLATYKGDDNFLRNENGAIVVYTDGACPKNGKRNSSGDRVGTSGCGVFFSEKVHSSFRNPSMDLPGGVGNTNNFAEAHAIEKALQTAMNLNFKNIEIRKIIDTEIRVILF